MNKLNSGITIKTVQQLVLGINEIAVQRENGIIITYSLGSCVGVCLYDEKKHIGGMAHCLLPRAPLKADSLQTADKPGKYVNLAVGELLRRITETGGRHHNITARLFGGASMFTISGGYNSSLTNIGQANIAAAQSELARLAIPLLVSETGGTKARTVVFNVSNGHAEVKTLAANL